MGITDPSLFEEANHLLRSTYQIAQRQGKDTNWDAFEKQVKAHLDKAHRFMYPEQYPLPESANSDGSVQVKDGRG